MAKHWKKHVAWDYQSENPIIVAGFKDTLCDSQCLMKNIDNDNPTCFVCHRRKNSLISDLQWDDRLFQIWLNEYDAMYRHQLARGITTNRASYVAQMGIPYYCHWLANRLWGRDDKALTKKGRDE